MISSNFQIKCAQSINLIRAREIARLYYLEDVMDHVLTHGDTGLPYHNAKHCTVVMRYAHEIAMLSREKFTFHEMQMLLCGALFHDFGHTGQDPDVNNISIAVRNMKLFMTGRGFLSESDLNIVEGIIRVTEYPFCIEPRSYLQMIIRDADLMQVMDIDNIEVVVHGLREELSAKYGRPITVEEFYAGQVTFMDNVKLYTDVGNRMYQAAKPHVIACFYSSIFPAEVS